jgi:glycosyltransferase involved in cell wall biosynthesis
VTPEQSEPRVSVVIPTHNRAHIVPDTIDSVLAQDYPNLELIIIDDGSGDGTEEVLRHRYGDRIVFERQPQSGVESARLRGKRLATGEYVNFLDDDDLMYPDKIRRQVALLQRVPEAGLAHCAFDFVDEKGAYLQTSRFLPDGDVRAALTHGCFPWSGGPLIRRSCLDVIGDDEHRDWYGDWGMWLRIALAGYSFGYVPSPLGAYRMLRGSMTDVLVRNVERLVLNVLDWVYASGKAPNSNRDARKSVYAGWHSWIAYRYFAGGYWEDGRRSLEAVLALSPDLRADGRYLAMSIVTDAVTPRMRVQDPVGFVRSVFDHLPDSARFAASHRRWAEAATFMLVGIAEFGAGRPEAAASYVAESVAADPGMARDDRWFAAAVKDHARNLPNERHEQYLNDVFEHLPPTARELERARPRARAETALVRAEGHVAAGDRGQARREAARAVVIRPRLARHDDVRRLLLKPGSRSH